jgi:hypothetical protein
MCAALENKKFLQIVTGYLMPWQIGFDIKYRKKGDINVRNLPRECAIHQQECDPFLLLAVLQSPPI